jgi:diacylglycerol kinase (ATP)
MPQKKVKLIVNPNADLGRAWKWAADLRPIVDSYGGADWIGTVYPTHATELARQAAESGYETIIAAGGDGTVHEIINGLMQVPAGRRPKLGVVPLGSGNDFSHAIGVPPDLARAMERAFNGKPHSVDVGVVRDGRGRTEYWNNSIGIGFDATVVIRSRKIPYVRGFLVYLVAVLQTILLDHEAPYIKFKSDQEAWEGYKTMLVLNNGGREGGGFHIAPPARPDDGVFHYVAIRQVSRLMMIRILPEVMRGTHQRFPQITMNTFKQMTLSADRPLNIHTDGEIFAGFGVDVRDLSVEIIPAAVQVLI